MAEYESKQQQILLPADAVYTVISRMDNLTPALQDKVEEWQADENHCSFKAKGFTVKLQIIDKEQPKYVKITGDDGGVPIDFNFWIQLHSVSECDTRIRLVLHADLNMMMKMMIGGKIKPALDQMVENIAQTFNMAAGRG
ncbi:MAG: polyketide cyclase [Alistipes sp.]|nr:polyketide cyclase [Alistipes sp.]